MECVGLSAPVCCFGVVVIVDDGSTVASYAISNGMEYLLPPLDPYGHDDAELYESFFEHKPYRVAMQAANVIQLQCTNKYKTLHHLEHSFPNDTQPWWPIGGVDEFTKV